MNDYFAALHREAQLVSNKEDVMWEPGVVGMNTDEDGNNLLNLWSL